MLINLMLFLHCTLKVQYHGQIFNVDLIKLILFFYSSQWQIRRPMEVFEIMHLFASNWWCWTVLYPIRYCRLLVWQCLMGYKPSRAECRSPEKVRFLWLCLMPDTIIPATDRTCYPLSTHHKIAPRNELYFEEIMGNTGESTQTLKCGVNLQIHALLGSLVLTCDDRNSQPIPASAHASEWLMMGGCLHTPGLSLTLVQPHQYPLLTDKRGLAAGTQAPSHGFLLHCDVWLGDRMSKIHSI